METKSSLIESLFEKAEVYVQTNVDLFKLKTIDKSADVVSTLVSKIALIFIFILTAFTLNIGLALWIGELIGKFYYGFFIIAAFYILVGIVLFFFNEKLIKKPVNDSIIIQLQK